MIRDIPVRVILILGFLVSGIIPLLIAFLLSFSTAKEELKKQAFMQLESVRDIKKSQVERYYREKAGHLQILALNPSVVGLVAEFDRAADAVPAPDPTERDDPAGTLRIHADEVFRFSFTQPGWNDLLLLGGRTTTVATPSDGTPNCRYPIRGRSTRCGKSGRPPGPGGWPCRTPACARTKTAAPSRCWQCRCGCRRARRACWRR